MNRRGLLAGLIAAPFVARLGVLMPVRVIEHPPFSFKGMSVSLLTADGRQLAHQPISFGRPFKTTDGWTIESATDATWDMGAYNTVVTGWQIHDASGPIFYQDSPPIFSALGSTVRLIRPTVTIRSD